MSWGKVDDRLAEHPKWVALERQAGPRGWADAMAVWLAVLCYANRNETDGAIETSLMCRLTPLGKAAVKAADAMVSAGLMDKTEHGYELHDFTDYNPSRADRAASREATSERVSRHRSSRSCNSVTNAVTNASVTPLVTALPSRPVPSPEEGETDAPLTADAVTPCHVTSRSVTLSHATDPATPDASPAAGATLTADSEAVRIAVWKACEEAKIPKPRETRALGGKLWIDLAYWCRERASLDRSTVEAVAAHLVAGWMAADRATKAHPVSWLAASPDEYWKPTTKPAVADADYHPSKGVPVGPVQMAAYQAWIKRGCRDTPWPEYFPKEAK